MISFLYESYWDYNRDRAFLFILLKSLIPSSFYILRPGNLSRAKLHNNTAIKTISFQFNFFDCRTNNSFSLP